MVLSNTMPFLAVVIGVLLLAHLGQCCTQGEDCLGSRGNFSDKDFLGLNPSQHIYELKEELEKVKQNSKREEGHDINKVEYKGTKKPVVFRNSHSQRQFYTSRRLLVSFGMPPLPPPPP
eukprot:c811_g1_i1 orf=3-356(-)